MGRQYLRKAGRKGRGGIAQPTVEVPISDQVDVEQLVGVSHRHISATWQQVMRYAPPECLLFNLKREAQVLCLALVPA